MVHCRQAVTGHLVNAQFRRRAKTVFGRTEHAIGMVAVPLKLQHHVHHVLEDLGSGQRPLLGDVAHHEQWGARGLRPSGEGGRGFTDLAHRTRHAILVWQVQSLHRIDHHKGRSFRAKRVKDSGNLRLWENQHLRCDVAEAVGPHADLFCTLFPAHIQDLGPCVSDRQGHLQHQRRLADARLTTEQNHAAWHRTASKHPIELFVAHVQARQLGDADVHQRADLRRLKLGETRPGRSLRHGRHRLLGQGVPRLAIAALPHPLRMGVSALGADEALLGLGHVPVIANGRCSPCR